MSSYCEGNKTTVTGFLLKAFSVSRNLECLLFTCFLMLYLFMIAGNTFIITIVKLDKSLQRPMYFLLGNFSGIEICYTTVFMPKMLSNLLTSSQNISLYECYTQMYFYVLFGLAQLFLLAVMAFDRYQAVCYPLHYAIKMSKTNCLILILICWMSGIFFNVPPLLVMTQSDFCCNNIINHFMCDGPGVIQLSCSDNTLNDIISFIFSLTTMFSSFIVTLVSYFWVIYTVLKIPSKIGRGKTFSTCSSHLTAAAIYYGTLIFMYVRPQIISAYDMNKIVAMLYTIIIPAMNPLIYSLRNKEVKQAVRKLINKLYGPKLL